MKSITQPVTEGTRHRQLPPLLSNYRTESDCGCLIVTELAVNLIVPAALSGGNIANVAQAAGPLVITALGMPLVIVKGDLGLSVRSVFSLTRMVSGVVMSDGYGAVPADSRPCRPVW